MFDLCKTAVQKNKSGYIRIEEVDLEERTKTMNCGENYECLLQIFQYLPIADKIRFERVNKLWRDASQKSWRNNQVLNFRSETLGVLRKKTFIDKMSFQKIIQLCGKHLTSIDLNIHADDDEDQDRNETIKHIFGQKEVFEMFKTLKHLNSFNNLQELGLFCQNISKKCYLSCATQRHYILQQLRSCGKNIIKFGIDIGHFCYTENDIASILITMKNLKYLHIRDHTCNSSFSGTSLLELSCETIEELNLDLPHQTLTTSNFFILIGVIRRITKLRTFKWKCWSSHNPELLFQALAVHAKSLENLLYNTTYFDNHSFSLTNRIDLCITQMKSLKKLNLSGTAFVNGDLLRQVGNNCKKLTYLNIIGCNNVYEDNILSLMNLPNLQLRFRRQGCYINNRTAMIMLFIFFFLILSFVTLILSSAYRTYTPKKV